LAGENLTQDCSKREDVAATIDKFHLATSLLGRHVDRCADDQAIAGDAFGIHSTECQTKICQQRLP